VGFQNGLLSLLDGFEIPDQFEDCLASIKAQLKDSARRQVSLFFGSVLRARIHAELIARDRLLSQCMTAIQFTHDLRFGSGPRI
jgi:hypothetical protein